MQKYALKMLLLGEKHMQTIIFPLFQIISEISPTPASSHQHAVEILSPRTSFALFFLPPSFHVSLWCWKRVSALDQLLFTLTWHNSWNSFVVGLRSLCLFVQRADFFLCFSLRRVSGFVDEIAERKNKFLVVVKLWRKGLFYMERKSLTMTRISKT